MYRKADRIRTGGLAMFSDANHLRHTSHTNRMGDGHCSSNTDTTPVHLPKLQVSLSAIGFGSRTVEPSTLRYIDDSTFTAVIQCTSACSLDRQQYESFRLNSRNAEDLPRLST